MEGVNPEESGRLLNIQFGHNRIKKYAIRLLAVALAVWLLLWTAEVLIARFVDLEEIAVKIEDGVEDDTNLQLDIGRLRIQPTLFGGLKAVALDSTLYDDNGDRVATIGQGDFYLRYWPLIREQLVSISRVDIKSIRFWVDRERVVEILQEFPEQEEREGGLEDATITLSDLTLKDYYVDAFGNRSPILYQIDYLAARNIYADRPIYLTGEIDLYKLGTDDYIYKDRDLYLNIRATAEIEQHALKEAFVREDIREVSVRLLGEGIRFRADYSQQQDDAVLGLDIDRLALGQLREAIRVVSVLVKVPLPAVYDQYTLRGLVSGGTDIRLRFNEADEPRVTAVDGRAQVSDLRLAQATTGEIVLRDLDARFRLDGNVIRTSRLTAVVDGTPVTVQGNYNWGPAGFENDRLDARLNTTNQSIASLKQTVYHVARLFEQPVSEQLAAFEASGRLDVSLRLFGPLRNLDYTGRFAIREGRYRNPQTGMLLTDIRGTARLNDRIVLERLAARWGDAALQAAGSISKDFHDYDLRVQARNVDVSRLYREVLTQLPQLPEGLENITRLSGTATADLRIRGPQDVTGEIHVVNALVQTAQAEVPLRIPALTVQLDGGELTVPQTVAYLGGASLQVGGQANLREETYRFEVTGEDLNLQAFYDEVLVHVPQARQALAGLTRFEGMGDVDLAIATGGQVTGTMTLERLIVQTPQLEFPVEIPRLVVSFAGRAIRISPARGRFGPVAFAFEGGLADLLQPGGLELALTTDTVPTAFLRENPRFLERLTALDLPPVWNTAGSFTFEGAYRSGSVQGQLRFNDMGLSWEGGEFPVYDVNGSLAFSQRPDGQWQVTSEDLTLRYGNSSVNPEIQYADTIDMQVEGVLSPLLVNHYLTTSRATHAPYRAMPFETIVRGTFENLMQSTIEAFLYLDLGRHFMMAERPMIGPSEEPEPEPEPDPVTGPGTDVVAPLPEPEPEPIVMAPLGEMDETDVALGGEEAYLRAQLLFENGRLSLNPARLHLMDAGDLWAIGEVENIFAYDPAYRLRVVTDPIIRIGEVENVLMEGLFADAEGMLTADVSVTNLPETEQEVNGWIELGGIRMPRLQVQNLTGEARFEDQEVVFDFPSVNLPGINLSVRALTHDVFASPIPLENVVIRGSLLSVPNLQHFSREVMDRVINQEIMARLVRPWQEGDPVVPVEFRGGDLAINEVIYENILLENVTADFSLYASGLFELDNASLEVADGTATGYLSMAPAENNFTSLELHTEDVNANAITRALLDVTNQIFGDVDSTIRFTTQGIAGDEMLENANGTVNLVIRNGRLPAIAQIETLLTAANVIRGGILNLNLGNLFRVLAPFDTDYFAEMSGDLQIAESYLYTDNLLSDGKNLDLLIMGEVRMEDGYSDLTVIGEMSQDVSGRLGALGRFSIGRILRYIPFLGTGETGIIGQIPVVGYIPGFGGAVEETNRFKVEIEGQPNDPGAIQDFSWIE